MDDNFTISFVIPAYNEQEIIGKTLLLIKHLMRDISYEVIVVDNGSTDGTANIVRQFDAKLLIDASKTIAGLRNLGASHAKGQILVFLDADVMITEQWVENIFKASERIDNVDGAMITGSRCGISNTSGWIEKYWFLPMCYDKEVNYINSGHLIVEKTYFDKLGGFNANMITGEDYEICLRAKEKGYIIENDPELYVIHEGYPKTISNFIKREIWHGTQDVRSFHDFISSKVAIAGFIYLVMPLFGIVAGMLTKSFVPVLFCCTISLAIALTAALSKRRKYPLNIGAYFLIYNIYFFSRGLSLVKQIRPFRTVKG